jgi:hypothetical protein
MNKNGKVDVALVVFLVVAFVALFCGSLGAISYFKNLAAKQRQLDNVAASEVPSKAETDVFHPNASEKVEALVNPQDIADRVARIQQSVKIKRLLNDLNRATEELDATGKRLKATNTPEAEKQVLAEFVGRMEAQLKLMKFHLDAVVEYTQMVPPSEHPEVRSTVSQIAEDCKKADKLIKESQAYLTEFNSQEDGDSDILMISAGKHDQAILIMHKANAGYNLLR